MTVPEPPLYPCVGICMTDPDSGYCLGCGRPPLETPVVVAEVIAVNPKNRPKNTTAVARHDPDTPP